MTATAVQPRVAPASADAALPPVAGATGPLVVPTVAPAGAPAAARRGRRNVVLLVLLLIVAAVAAVAVPMLIAAAGVEDTDDAFVDADVVRAAPQVAGRVVAVAVTDNQLVDKGTLLVRVDPRDTQVAVRDAQAGLAEARGRLEQAKAQIAVASADALQADAEVDVAQANQVNAAADLKRYTQLEARAVSRQLKDAATAAAQSTAAQVVAAQRKAAAAHAQVDLNRTQIDTAKAVVDTSQAKLDQANLNLSYTDLRAAVDGRVTRKNVEPGNYVQVGQQLMAIVPTDVYVTANFKETQLERMHKGQGVDIHVDAYPHHAFHGTVDSVQAGTGSAFSLLPPENATGNFVKVVQRVPVKILLDGPPDPRYPLSPGMSVEPDVHVK